jgi:hypothetical protein
MDNYLKQTIQQHKKKLKKQELGAPGVIPEPTMPEIPEPARPEIQDHARPEVPEPARP